MNIHDRIIVKIVLSAALFIPLAGGIYVLIKILIQQVVDWKIEGLRKSDIVTKMVLTIIMLAFGVISGSILICVFWFPHFHVPLFMRLSVFVFIIPYLGCIFGLAYGLSSVVAIANVSSAQMFSQLFGMKSKSNGGTKQEAKKHKTVNNSEK